jgi:regulator of sigma D
VLWQRLNNGKSRWNKTDAVIDSWLKERQQLLQQFMAATRLPSLQGKIVSPAVHVVERETLVILCNTLVDYVSMLHFEILEQLSTLESQLKERMALHHMDQTSPIPLGLNRLLLEKILKSTNTILDFELNCQKLLKTKKPLSTIKEELSILGEVLAGRMDLEDALIHAYVWARTALPRI